MHKKWINTHMKHYDNERCWMRMDDWSRVQRSSFSGISKRRWTRAKRLSSNRSLSLSTLSLYFSLCLSLCLAYTVRYVCCHSRSDAACITPHMCSHSVHMYFILPSLLLMPILSQQPLCALIPWCLSAWSAFSTGCYIRATRLRRPCTHNVQSVAAHHTYTTIGVCVLRSPRRMCSFDVVARERQQASKQKIIMREKRRTQYSSIGFVSCLRFIFCICSVCVLFRYRKSRCCYRHR